MGPYRKVVWNEGMLLTPHHFQQWDNYHEGLLNSRVEALMPYPWGVLKLRLSEAALAKGSCEVSECSAVMPDGLPVDIPHADAAPAPRPVGDLVGAEGGEGLGVYLCVPALRAGAPNFQSNGGERRAFVRFSQEPARVKDETTGENEQQLSFARSNLRLMFDGESLEGYHSLRVAKIGRTPAGALAYDEKYIPPALDVAASPWLARALRDLFDILTVKSDSLAEQHSQNVTSDVKAFWLLHTVNSFIPVLGHMLRTQPVHPERLYVELATLCGQLMTFADGRHPQEIVPYDHLDLYVTFSRLFSDLRELLEIVIPSRCMPIELKRISESVYAGRVPEGLPAETEFYLAVKAKVSGGQIIDRAPLVFKIASRDIILRVSDKSVPGLDIEYVAAPPQPPLPPLTGFHVFQFERAGLYWDSISRSGTVAVYVPSEFHEPQLLLFAVKPAKT